MGRAIPVAALITIAFGSACGAFGTAASDAPDGGVPAAPDAEAGEAGAPPPDGAVGARSCVGRLDVEVCEAFDSDDFGARGWTRSVPSGAALDIDPGAGVLGSAGKFFTPSGATNDGPFLTRPMNGLASGFVRVFVRIDRLPADAGTHPLIIRPPVELDLVGGSLALNQYEDPVLYKRSANGVPIGRWFCLEWELTSTTSTVRVDGTTQIAVEHTYGSPSDFRIGVEYNETTSAAFTIRYDELAIGPTRIGCQ